MMRIMALLLNSSHVKLSTRKSQIQRPTIFALSTPPGISAVAVIRISGPNARDVPLKMANFKVLPPARSAMLRRISDPITKEALDKSLLFWFPSPSSYTGEDICELHVHGSIAVIRTMLKALAKLPSYRPAEAGEFTRRAFLAGKLDLTEIEGLADLLNAQTEAQQRQALKQMDGHLLRLYSHWTDQIKNCLAKIEAYIDFGEDENLEDDLHDTVIKDVQVLCREMQNHLSDNRRGEKLRSGLSAVLVGQPNVGKSSLLNAICQRDVAIVSSTPGTTRDVVEGAINLGGFLVHLSDTAGIRKSQDEIEIEGVKRAYKKFFEADVVLFVTEAHSVLHSMKSLQNPNMDEVIKHIVQNNLNEQIVGEGNLTKKHIEKVEMLLQSNNIILLLNKMDLLNEEELIQLEKFKCSVVCPVSCLCGSGIQEFLNCFTHKVEQMFSTFAGEAPLITQERHRIHVQKCLNYLKYYCNFMGHDAAIRAEHLRKGTYELSRITGKITTDDILDIIFKDFCIGK